MMAKKREDTGFATCAPLLELRPKLEAGNLESDHHAFVYSNNREYIEYR